MRTGSRRLLDAALKQYKAEDDYRDLRYTCDPNKLPTSLSAHFVQLSADQQTQAFLKESRNKSRNVCLQLLYTLIQILFGLFLSQTSINGLLEKGRMFIFSSDHLSRLLPSFPSPPTFVLDIGSGDGHVTDQIRQALGPATIHVTEMSRVMQRTLRKKKYRVIDANTWHEQDLSYDIISCLNVLDRCSAPVSMLKQMHNRLKIDGLLLLALVLPYQPFVENGPIQSAPEERLPLKGMAGWEGGVQTLWEMTLKPLGFDIVSVSRLPYLCEGDFNQDYYSLDDAVFVLRKQIDVEAGASITASDY